MEPRYIAVDLEITIRVAGGTLSFEVGGSEIEQTLRSPVTLPSSPEEYLRHLFHDIENLPVDTEEARAIAEDKLASKGLTIWSLFPSELQELLWQRRGEAQTLLIFSEELDIPWEIAKLQSRGLDGRAIPGPFLCEAFAVTRWLHGMRYRFALPLQKLALVVPKTSRLPGAAVEKREIHALARGQGREVTSIEPATPLSVARAMASGIYDGWHFAGHGEVEGDDADRWYIQLEDDGRLAAEDLLGEPGNLGLTNPLVFLNGCTTGRTGLSLAGPGGLARGFLGARAGAFIGTCWEVSDRKSRELAETFYRGLFNGLPIGEAFRQARLRLRKKYQGDLTWLAYRVFAHPMASCTGLRREATAVWPASRGPAQIAIPILRWQSSLDPPGGLLHAKHRVVPFHRRERELADLQNWCQAPDPIRVRLYTGAGGMGKTRLALETALKMREEGWWTGFATAEALRSPEDAWKALARPEGKLLLIVDYAEGERTFLAGVLREMRKVRRGPFRLLLLARAALDWWEQLKQMPDGVGSLLSGPATSKQSLEALADSIVDRSASYHIAAQAFSECLARPLPAQPPSDLDAKHFERVLLLHMNALIDVEGEESVQGMNGILDRVLARERMYWEKRADDRGIAAHISAGIGRGMAAITLGGGVAGEAEAVAALRGLRFFSDQPTAVLTAVARVLHDCYSGERWIEPLQPDLLGEQLVIRELQQGATELLDLVLGAQNRGLMT